MITTLLKPLPGLLVQLAISWILVWLVEKRNLGVLGLFPTRRRLADFTLFFFITILCCASGFIMRMVFAHEQWQVNPSLSPSLIISGSWWNLCSVLYEELIFRGVILYILIRRLGAIKGIVISSIAFGIYHWFSYNQWGNVQQMVITFFVTGIIGLLYAFAYARTHSLYAPIAIHFGWNLTNGFIFSQGPIGNGVFIPVSPQPQVTVSYFTFGVIMVVPILCALLINYFVLKRRSVEFQVTGKASAYTTPHMGNSN